MIRTMRRNNRPGRQKGVTLIVGMIMLMLITVMVTTAFTMSSSNSKSVGNMQFRDEAIAAANKAIEEVISGVLATGFTTLPSGVSTYHLDINNDGADDYDVLVAVPECVQSITVSDSAPPAAGTGSSVTLSSFTSAATFYNTLWNIRATVTDPVSKTSVEIHQGVRLPLNETQHLAVCP